MTVLHLVRHGQSEWNVARLVQGQTAHVPLTALGREQAADAAAALAGRDVAAIYSSDLLRARETAGIIAARLGVPVIDEPGLRERSYGTFEGSPSADVLAATRDVDWSDPDTRIGGGESQREVAGRVGAALARLRAAHPGEAVVVVSHGDAIRVATAVLAGEPVERLPWRDVPNGSITTVGPDGQATGVR